MKRVKMFIVIIIFLVFSILIYENVPSINKSEKVIIVMNGNEVIGEENIVFYVKKYSKILRNDEYIGYIIIVDERYEIITTKYSKDISLGVNEYVVFLRKLIDGELYHLSAIRYSKEDENYGYVLGKGDFYITRNMEHIIGSTPEITNKYGVNSYVKTQGSNWDRVVLMEYE